MLLRRVGVDTIIGVVFLLFALYWNTLINGLPAKVRLTRYGAAFFPRIIVFGIIIISIVLIIRDFGNRSEKNKFNLNKCGALKVLLLVTAIIIYSLIMPIVGYMLSTIIVLAFALWLFGLRNKLVLILVSVSFPVMINYFFQVLLRLPLP